MTDPTNDEILADLERRGFLPGDGRTLSRDDYPALYAAIESLPPDKEDDRAV